MEESSGVTAGTHKSSQKPQESSVLWVTEGQRFISQEFKMTKAGAPPISVCVGANVCE